MRKARLSAVAFRENLCSNIMINVRAGGARRQSMINLAKKVHAYRRMESLEEDLLFYVRDLEDQGTITRLRNWTKRLIGSTEPQAAPDFLPKQQLALAA